MTTSGKDRMKAHRQAKKDRGLSEVTVWVPKGCEEEVKVLAKVLRELVAA